MKFITDPYLELPVTFKTVSEFRRTRTVDGAVGDGICQVSSCEPGQTVQATVSSSESLPVPVEYFGADSSVTAPTSFVSPDILGDSGVSALSQFMSVAVDFESAFEFADHVSGDNGRQAAKIPLTVPFTAESKRGFSEPALNSLFSPLDTRENTGWQSVSTLGAAAVAACRSLEQASVLKDPQEVSATTITVEKDAYGRVIKSFFCGGECVLFQYDENAELREFNYAGMQWTRAEKGWSAQDRQTEYSLDGRISVLANGSLRIEREDVVRILKMSGTRIDEHRSGSRTESKKLNNKPSPYDLLAKAKAVNSIWLNARSPFKNSSEQSLPAPLKLDLVNDTNHLDAENERSYHNAMIPNNARVPAYNPAVIQESDLSCMPTSPIELRSLEERTDRLRNLEDSVLQTGKQNHTKLRLQLRIKECWLKSSLWLTDRIVGQSSPKHLDQLDRLAEIYFERQRNDLAELTHLRALHIREQFFGKGQAELAMSLCGLAKIYESRGDFLRAEGSYKEAIELQENGLRKILFFFSEKVTDATKLSMQLDGLFGCVRNLSMLYSNYGRQQLCAVVYEKALALAAEIVEREPAAEQALNESVEKHLTMMKHLCAPLLQ